MNLNLEVDVQVRTILGTLLRISSRSWQRIVLSWMSSLIHLPWGFVSAKCFGPWNRSCPCLHPNKTNCTKWKSNICQLLCWPFNSFCTTASFCFTQSSYTVSKALQSLVSQLDSWYNPPTPQIPPKYFFPITTQLCRVSLVFQT